MNFPFKQWISEKMLEPWIISVYPLLQGTIKRSLFAYHTSQPSNVNHVPSLCNHAWIWIGMCVSRCVWIHVCRHTYMWASALLLSGGPSWLQSLTQWGAEGKKNTDQGRQCLFIRFKPRFELKLSHFCPACLDIQTEKSNKSLGGVEKDDRWISRKT